MTHTSRSRGKHSPLPLDDLIAEYSLPRIREDDITIPRMVKKTGWNESRCKRIIIQKGYTVMVSVVDERGYTVTAYRKP